MVENLWTYYTTGIYSVIETSMIFFMVAFLGWNVKLFFEKTKENN